MKLWNIINEITLIQDTTRKEFKDESLYNGKIIFDGRKVLNRKSGDNYEGVCW